MQEEVRVVNIQGTGRHYEEVAAYLSMIPEPCVSSSTVEGIAGAVDALGQAPSPDLVVVNSDVTLDPSAPETTRFHEMLDEQGCSVLSILPEGGRDMVYAGCPGMLFAGDVSEETLGKVVSNAYKRTRSRMRLEQLSEANRRVANLGLSFSMCTADTYEASVREMLRGILEMTQGRAAYFCLIGAERLRFWESTSRDGQSGAGNRSLWPLGLEVMPWSRERFNSLQEYWWEGLESFPAEAKQERDFAMTTRLLGGYACPLGLQGKLQGLLMVACDAPERPCGGELASSLRTLGSRAVAANKRLATEQAMRDSRRQFQELFSGSLDGIIVSDTNGFILRTNPAVRRILGYPVDSLLGRHMNMLFPGQDGRGLDVWQEELRVNDGIFESQQLICADGKLRPADLTATLIPWDCGQAVMVTIRDVQERVNVEKERNRLSAAIEQCVESIVVTDAEGFIEYVNPSFLRTTGYAENEVMGRNISILRSGEHDEFFYAEIWNTIRRGEVWSGRLKNRRKDGSVFTEETAISPIRDRQGRIMQFVAVKSDVTEQERLDKQYRQAQKMEAIGVLAGGIAHDFNNILSPILGYVDMVSSELPDDSQHRQFLSEVYTAGLRARDLVKQILTFSRQMESDRRSVEACLVFKEALKLLRASIPSNVQIESDIGAKGFCVKSDPTQLHQIMMNLGTNAYQALAGEGGVVEVGLESIQCKEELHCVGAILGPGAYLCLSVEDNGMGMEPAVMERIFMPFFTTKGVGEGTGMGLSTVFGIVSDHGGGVTVSSKPGHGSCFRVYLPIADAPSDAEAAGQEAPQRGSESILVVDDESSVASLAGHMLSRLGYRVTTQTNPVAALHLFKQNPSGFDLILADRMMPKLTGERFVAAVKQMRPDLPALLMSGYLDSEGQAHAVEHQAYALVEKPIMPARLASLVRAALDDKAGGSIFEPAGRKPQLTGVEE